MTEFVHSLITWMSENDKLAGWAQFAGAMLAVVIAIWVPWYQTRVAQRAVRAARIERELASVEGVFFLLTDVRIWLEAAGGRGHMPRKLFRDSFHTADLLERVRLWESREESQDRVIALFLARGAILRTQEALGLPYLEDEPVTTKERALFQKCVDEMRTAIAEVELQRDRAHRDRLLNKAGWLYKPLILWLWPTMTRWMERWIDRRERVKPAK